MASDTITLKRPREHGALSVNLSLNSPATSSVTSALDAFVEKTLKAYPRLESWYDPEWPSPCEYGSSFLDACGERRILWRPVKRETPAADLEGLERALEMPIHPDVKAYYGAYWSGGLQAEAPQGHVSLILLWNAQDADRLVENLIGHALAKRRARSPFTLFFACTEPDADSFLSIDNASGQVLLEEPGRKPLRTVADSLADFLRSLEPAPPSNLLV